MVGIVDASVLVRYLTGDPPDMAERAARFIEGTAAVILTDVAIVETCYVLESVYKVNRAVIVDHMMALIARTNIKTRSHVRGTVLQALFLCRGSRRISFADALIWATARESTDAIVYTFDQRFPAEGIVVRGPSA